MRRYLLGGYLIGELDAIERDGVRLRLIFNSSQAACARK